MNSPLPGAPPPSWPAEPCKCPRCGSPETTLDEVNYRFLLLTLLKATTCRACGFQFSARTGGSTMPIVIAAYVVPFAIPEVIRHANAFVLGAQATRPSAKVRLVWTNSWFDPKKERQAAESLVSAGADVLGQNVDSPSTGQYAESKKVPWVGYNSDARKFAPTSWLTAAVYDWGPYYLKRVKAAANGSWKTGSYYGNIADGFTDIAPYGPKVSAKTKAAIAAKRAQLIKGTFYEFQGPLYDQAGKLRVPKGKRMTLPQILTMDWLVKGIEGSPKG